MSSFLFVCPICQFKILSRWRGKGIALHLAVFWEAIAIGRRAAGRRCEVEYDSQDYPEPTLTGHVDQRLLLLHTIAEEARESYSPQGIDFGRSVGITYAVVERVIR